MKITVLGSSSSGNCYILENNHEALILEAGVRFDCIQNSLSFNIGKIAGCLVTHEHKDHSKYASDLVSAAIDVYASSGTIECLSFCSHRLKTVKPLKKYQIGGFDVVPFKIKHDSKEPLGFLIYHTDMGRLLFATDTYYIEHRFSGLNHVMIECNYSQEILEKNVLEGKVVKTVRDRILASHMELSTCINFLKSNDLKEVINIVLIHLSSQNSDAPSFIEKISAATGKQVFVAKSDLTVNISKEVF